MEHLKSWRMERGLSLEEAGKLIGVSGVQWHRYEVGKRRVSTDKLAIISSVTGIPTQEIRPDLADILARPAPRERVS